MLHGIPLPGEDLQAVEQDANIIIVASNNPALKLLNPTPVVRSAQRMSH